MLFAVCVGAAALCVGVGLAVVRLGFGEAVVGVGVAGDVLVAAVVGAAVVFLALADGFAEVLAGVGDVTRAAVGTGADGLISLVAGPQTSLYVALLEVFAGASSILISAQPLPALAALTVPLLTGRVAGPMKFSVCTGPGFPDE